VVETVEQLARFLVGDASLILRGDEQDGNRRAGRFAETGRGVARPRPWNNQTDPRPTRGPRIAVGHERRGLLVPDQDVTNLIPILIERIVDPLDMPAGHTEDGVHPLRNQAANQDLSTDHVFSCFHTVVLPEPISYPY